MSLFPPWLLARLVPRGRFWMADPFESSALRRAFVIVDDTTAAWDTLRNFDGNFLDTKDGGVLSLMNKVNSDYPEFHSSFTLAWTMRRLHYIARYGWRAYAVQIIKIQS